MVVWYRYGKHESDFHARSKLPIARLQDAATRLSLPKSEVVREAIQEFHERIGQLSERERLRMLRAFDEVVPRIPTRSLRTVTNELSAIRRARKPVAGNPRAPGAVVDLSWTLRCSSTVSYWTPGVWHPHYAHKSSEESECCFRRWFFTSGCEGLGCRRNWRRKKRYSRVIRLFHSDSRKRR